MCLITDTLTCFRLFSFSSHTFVFILVCSKKHTHTHTHNTQTVPLHESECLRLYLTHSGVHAETLLFSVHTPLKEIRLDTHVWMTLCPSTSIRVLLPHNTQTPFLSLLFDVETSSTFPVSLRDFFLFCGGPWSSMAEVRLPRKSLSGSWNRGQVWVQLGWRWEIGRGSRRSLRHDLVQCKINRKSGLKKNVEDDRIQYLPAGHCRT